MLGIPSSSGSGSSPLRDPGVSGDSVVASDKADMLRQVELKTWSPAVDLPHAGSQLRAPGCAIRERLVSNTTLSQREKG